MTLEHISIRWRYTVSAFMNHIPPRFKASLTRALSIALISIFILQPFSPLAARADGPTNVAPSSPVIQGSSAVTTNASQTYTVQSTDADGDQINYGFDWNNDGIVDGYTGFVASGAPAQLSHTWATAGTYTFSVIAKDALNNVSDPGTMTVTASTPMAPAPAPVNSAPNKPNIITSASGTTGATQSFSVSATDPEGDSVVYGFDWNNDGVVDEWSAPVASGISASASHTWPTAGNYTVLAYAKDTHGAQSDPASVTISIADPSAPSTGGGQPAPSVNAAPGTPSVSGPTTGTLGSSYTFNVQSVDPENGQVAYGFDWNNDGIADEWTNYVNSGTSASVSHVWSSAGTYTFGVYAKDAGTPPQTSSPATHSIVISSGQVVSQNTAPNVPTVTGPSTGTVGTSYSFTATAQDPQLDNVMYGFDWDGNGIVDEWTAPVASGASGSASHAWSAAGTYSPVVYAKDSQGAISDSATLAISIASVPVAPVNSAPSSPDVTVAGSTAGSPVSFSALSTDPDGDQVAYGFDWNNDGIADEWTNYVNSGVSATLSHTWTTPGSYTVGIYARDAFSHYSQAATKSVDIVSSSGGGGGGGNGGGGGVTNSAPNAPTVTGPSTGTVGSSYSFTATAQDPQLDSVMYGFDWNNDGVIDEWTAPVASGISSSVSHSWNSIGNYTFKTYAKDSQGAVSDLFSSSISIAAAPSNPVNSAPTDPTVTITGNAVNAPVAFSALSTDPDGDQIAYGFDWNNDGIVDEWTNYVNSGTSAGLSHTWTAPGSYTVGVFARDAFDHQSSGVSQPVTIVLAGGGAPDGAPNTPTVAGPSTGTVGASYSFTATSIDPEGDTISYGFNWGDGTADSVSPVASGTSLARSHAWTNPGTYTLSVFATDAHDVTSIAGTASIVISNAVTPPVNRAPTDPTVTITGNAVNAPVAFSSLSTDPDGDQVAYGFDWNNDGIADEWTNYVNSGTSAGLSHTWTVPGTYTVVAYARDAFDNKSAGVIIPVSIVSSGGGNGGGGGVTNSAPNVPTVVGPSTGVVGASYSFTATSVDPEGDNVSYAFDWGDGTADSVSALSSGISVAQPHVWANPGTYTVSVVATDAHNAASNAGTASVVISSVTPPPNPDPSVPAVTVSGDIAGSPVTFVAESTDPNNEQITYGFDWNNNGVVDEWSPAAASGAATTVTHIFSAPGTYLVNVFAKDASGNISPAYTFTVTVISSGGGGGGGPTGTFVVTPTTGLTTTESGGTATFSVVLGSAPISAVSVPVTSSDFTEGTTSTTLLVFTPSNWNTAQTVTVTGIDDTNVDGDVPYTVSVGPSSSSDVNYSGLAVQTVSIVNNDNDSASNGGGTTSVPSTSVPGSRSGGGGGGAGGPCFGYDCPTTTTTTTVTSSVPNDIWILIDTLKNQPTAVGPSAPELVCPSVNFVTTFLRAGIDNNPNEVRKLQYFLNTYENAGIAVDGTFGSSTEDAVKAFQAKYASDVLAPWGTTTPTGIVYITTARKINEIYCGDHPDYNGQGLKDIFDNTVLNGQPPANTGQFQGVVGQATTTNPVVGNLSNIAGAFGAFSQKVLDALRQIPIYQLLILLLLILGVAFIVQGTLIKDIPIIKDVESLKAYAAFLRGLAVLSVGTVLNVLNTLSFMLNPSWLAERTGLTLPWVLGLDMVNGIAVIASSLWLLVALYRKIAQASVGMK